MTNLFTNLSKNGSEPVNGSRMDRHYTENGPIHSRQLFAVLVMLWVKLVNLVNFVMQIFDESLKSLKCLMSNFATSATFASANFVGKASNESTEMYRVKSRIPSCYLRHASVIALICFLGIGEIWGEDEVVAAFESSSVVTSTTYQSYSDDNWLLSKGGNSNSCGFNKTNKTTIENTHGTSATSTRHGY